MKNISSKKKIASHWFKTLQDQICEELQNIETKHSNRNNKFKKTKREIMRAETIVTDPSSTAV